MPPMEAESEKVVPLKGMPDNPGRDPKVKDKTGRGSMGDKAFTDSLIIIGIALAFLLFLVYSLRHHNV